MDHLFMELMSKIRTKLPLDLATLKMTKYSDIEDDYEDALAILQKYRDGFFLDMMLENNQTDVNSFDFLNFIRPDTRYGKMYEPASTPESRGVGTTRKGKLEPIPELAPIADKKSFNPRDKMRADLQNKEKGVKTEKPKSSSKALLWLDRAKRIQKDVDESIETIKKIGDVLRSNEQ